jgi:hypothetical protein
VPDSASRFHSRVHVLASNGRWLARVPAARAEQLLKREAVVEERRNGLIFAVKVCALPSPPTPPTPLSPASYVGQRYIFVRRVGADNQQTARCYEHKRIHPDDSDMFVRPLADVCKPPRNGGPC